MKIHREERTQDGVVAQLAEDWGITRAGVWTIEQRAICKLRNGILNDPVLRAMAEEVCGLDLDDEQPVSVYAWFKTPHKAKAERTGNAEAHRPPIQRAQ